MTSSATTANPGRLTLSAGLRGTDNAFGVIRLILASSVIFSHAFYLGGWVEDPTHGLTHGQDTIGGIAVVGFFAVSGYLITKSGTRTDIMQFLWRRSLRIFPAFWGALLTGALVIGPLVWLQMGRGLGTYFVRTPGGPIDYVRQNMELTIRQWGIFDIFAHDTPYGGITGVSVFNGSLWTLAYEWRAYLVIAVLVLVGALRKAPIIAVFATAVLWVMAFVQHTGIAEVSTVWPGFEDRYYVTLTLAFLIGSTAAVLADRIVLDGRIALLAGAIAVGSLLWNGWVLVGYPAFAYVLFYLGAALPGWWRRIGQKNDYSYGMYVYGFLVQQLTAFWGWHRWGYIPWVGASILVTAVFALASWHLIEKRALQLKDWGPGRGLRAWWLTGRGLVLRATHRATPIDRS